MVQSEETTQLQARECGKSQELTLQAGLASICGSMMHTLSAYRSFGK